MRSVPFKERTRSVIYIQNRRDVLFERCMRAEHHEELNDKQRNINALELHLKNKQEMRICAKSWSTIQDYV